MSTTTLTTSVSSYTVYRRFGYFHLRSSTATSGSVEEGWGEWHVVRGGSIIHKCYKTMNFAWIGQDGDVVHVRYVDKAGNAGSFTTYTFSVTGTYTAEKYVDASGGSDSNSGTSGSPYATIDKAEAEVIALLSSGQEGAIWVKEGQTHNYSSTVITASSTARRVHLRRWGTSGSRPTCAATSEVGFAAHGTRGAILVDDVNITGAHTTNFTSGFSLERSGAGTRSPWDLIVMNSTITDFRWGIFVADDQWAAADRDNGNWDFFALENVTLTDSGEYHIYASNGINKQMIRGCTFGATVGFDPTRLFHVGDSFWYGCTMDTQGDDGIRFAQASGGTSAGATRDVTIAQCTWTTGDGVSVEPDAGVASTGWCRRFRVVDCVFNEGRVSMKAEAGPNMVDTDWLQIWDCSSVEAHSLGGNTSMSETLNHVDLWNCAATNAYGGGAGVVFLMGDKANWPDDSLTVRGCAALYNTIDNPEPRYLIQANNLTTAELTAVIALSNRNHLGKSDGDSLDFVSCSSGILSRSSWNTASGHDANSTTNSTTDFNWTALTAPINYRQDTSGGALDGTGYTDGYAIDADGFLRNASTPDAGPYEYGASTEPDEPSLGGGAIAALAVHHRKQQRGQ